MNERIRQLAEQALFESEFDDEQNIKITMDIFAELIVKECMLINRQRLFADFEGDTHRVAHNNALWCSVGDMQEHFGVEE